MQAEREVFVFDFVISGTIKQHHFEIAIDGINELHHEILT